MAITAPDEEGVVEAIRKSLSDVALRLVEVSEIAETTLPDFPDHLDEHLADNVRNWEPDKRTVWGTIHVYLADGEA
jgi:hypothetical protein